MSSAYKAAEGQEQVYSSAQDISRYHIVLRRDLRSPWAYFDT